MTSTLNFFDAVLFLLSNLLTSPKFMSISLLVLELWQFLFIRDWPEIWKSEIPPSEFCTISRDLGELEIPNLVRMYLIKCYWMLQNARVTDFTVSELSRENQLEGKITSPLPQPPTQIRVKKFMPTVEATKCWPQIYSLLNNLHLHNILHLVAIGIVLPISNTDIGKVFSTFNKMMTIGR